MHAPDMAPTAMFRAYRAATRAILPLAYRSVSRKLSAADVPPDRIRERLGHATLPRPDGPLVWFHAASVGESLLILTLINRLAPRLNDTQFLITSGTATSADLIARRLPPRCRHQFAPLDAPGPVTRFYDHWKPAAGIFIDSELWPVMLAQGNARGVRLALVNARLSERSVRGWAKRPDTARFVLNQFTLFLTQNARTFDNLAALGADPDSLQQGINLKSTSDPAPVDDTVLTQLRDALGDRPVWIASSTHPGEEQIVLAAHRQLLADHPDLCLLLVPRHPQRGDEVAQLISDQGLRYARRSAGQLPGDADQVYLADTLGETGTWYALSPLVFLGGSLMPIGGHNPFEPALARAAVLTGPHTTNFVETFPPLIAAGGAVEVADAPGLAAGIGLWLDQPDQLQATRDAAIGFVQAQQSALEAVIETLCTRLALEPQDA